MNIILVTHQFFPNYSAGTEVLTLQMAKGLIRLGHKTLVITGNINKTKTTTKKYVFEGVDVVQLNVKPTSLCNKIKAHTNKPYLKKPFKKTIKEFAPDIVHFNHIMGLSASLIPLVKNMGLPVVFTPTDFWSICPTTKMYRDWSETVCTNTKNVSSCAKCLVSKKTNSGPLLNKSISVYIKVANLFPLSLPLLSMPRELSTRNSTMANMVNSSDAILAPTLFMQKQLVDNGISKSRMRHVPFGVSAEHCAPHKKLPVGKRLKVGFIGSIVKYKGLHVLLQAIDRLGREQSCVEVLIYGDIEQGGAYANDMVSLGTKLESVKFCGTFHHSEIGDKLKNLDVLVVPSIWYENSPLVLSAALLSCTPVLVSRLGGMTESVREGVDGFSFESGNSKKLSSLISKFVNNRDLVLTLSKNLTTKHRRTDFEYIKDVESVYKQIV